ncbi:MAG: hypothetical protein AMK69_20905 [Nitrospira bacterium SG8_3]|nr:MAG: hypothetical protein AMK69_20905 [Nitrospira bacterium SG8_3]
MIRVAVVHNAVAPSDGPDEQDILARAALVHETVEGLGHEADSVPPEDVIFRLRTALFSAPRDIWPWPAGRFSG